MTTSSTRNAPKAGAAVALAGWLASFLLGCGPPSGPGKIAPLEIAGEAPLVHPALEAHTAEFEKQVYRVTDRVHVAVGYGLANSILIEGDDGAIVVDSTGSIETGAAVREAFAKITSKPIVALIYTHNHADHVFGGPGFVPDGAVDVYAHETTEYYINRVVSVLRPILGRRSSRMFGTHLETGRNGLVNCGIGPALEIGHGGTLGLLRPTHTFSDRLEVTLAGVEVHLVHAPGETNDQLFVWLPEERVLLPGDNVYKAFPNLYTIRGTLYRDVLEWSRSIDAMRALQPEHLVPSHTRPVSGAAAIDEILLAYRDAIQFVHDQTIRGMNRGLGPDQLVEVVRLPPHLAAHPYLQEFYGTVEWSVRSIFSGYLGWFNGDTATLSPASPGERAAGYVALAGGAGPLLDRAREAIDEGRFSWAAELATHILVDDPSSERARGIKAAALRELGRRSISPNGRNYYLTQALELEGRLTVTDTAIDDSVLDTLHGVPIGNFMESMPANLDAAKSAETDTVATFEFPDVDESYTLHVRRSVAAFRAGSAAEPDLHVRLNSQVWKEIVVGLRNPAAALARGEIEVEGGAIALGRFLSLFR